MKNERSTIHSQYDRLLEALCTPFPLARERLEAPDAHGVYVIRSPRGKILHVGRTVRGKNGLRQRLNNHLHGSSSFTRQYLHGEGKRLRGKYTFAFVLEANARRRALLEAYAVGNLCPAHLGLGENSTG